MRTLRIAAFALTALVMLSPAALADDADDEVRRSRMPSTQQVYTQRQRQQQRYYYYRQQQQESQGFWSRMMDLERRKNRFLLRLIGIGD